MTQVWPLLGLAPVPTVVSMNFRPVSVVMAFPCVCAAAGRAAARVAVTIMARRVTGMWRLFLGEVVRGQRYETMARKPTPIAAARAAERRRIVVSLVQSTRARKFLGRLRTPEWRSDAPCRPSDLARHRRGRRQPHV